jgi:predicted HTH transcriptional regulator
VDQLNKARSFIEDNVEKMDLPTSASMRSSIVYQYPMVCIREVLANAICHRDYEDTTRWVAVRIFSDRIEVANPEINLGGAYRTAPTS